MPFSSIQPVRPRRPQVGAIGRTTATAPSQLPRGPIMARGFARVMAGVAIITPMPRPAPRVTTKTPKVIVCSPAPSQVAFHQPLITPRPRTIQRRLAPLIVNPCPAPSQATFRHPEITARPRMVQCRLAPLIAAPRPALFSGRAVITLLPPKTPVVITKLTRTVSVFSLAPRPGAGRVFITRLPFKYVAPAVIHARPLTPIIVRPTLTPLSGKVFVPRIIPKKAGFTVFYVDTPPILGHTYYYRWRASDGIFFSPYGPTVSASTNEIPLQVMGLVAVGVPGEIVLTWTAIVNAATYNVYESLYPSDPAPALIASGLTTPTYTFVVTDTVLHYFHVSAGDDCGEGPLSAEVYAAALPQDHDCCSWASGADCEDVYGAGAECDTDWNSGAAGDSTWSPTGPC